MPRKSENRHHPQNEPALGVLPLAVSIHLGRLLSTQRRRDAMTQRGINPEWSGHQTVTEVTAATVLSSHCVLAPLRLCVKTGLNNYGLRVP